MLGVLESQFIRNFADRPTGIEHPFFGYAYQFHLNMLLSRPACFFLNQVTEIIGRQMQLLCTISPVSNPVVLGLSD